MNKSFDEFFYYFAGGLLIFYGLFGLRHLSRFKEYSRRDLHWGIRLHLLAIERFKGKPEAEIYQKKLIEMWKRNKPSQNFFVFLILLGTFFVIIKLLDSFF